MPIRSTMHNIIDLLLFGRPITLELTIPEGKNFYEIAAILETHGFISKARSLLSSPAIQTCHSNSIFPMRRWKDISIPILINLIHQSPAQIMRAMVEVFVKNKVSITAKAR